MAFTVLDVIEQARDQHPSHDPERTPESSLIRELNRYVRGLYMRVLERDSSRFTTVETIAWPLADFGVGHTMPAYVYIQGGIISFADSTELAELRIVPYRNRYTPGVPLAAYMHGGILYFCGREDDWQGTSQVAVSYAPEPTPLTARTDTVSLPESGILPCVRWLSYYMARRSASYEQAPVPMQTFLTEWREAEEEFLVEMAHHNRVESSYIREVW